MEIDDAGMVYISADVIKIVLASEEKGHATIRVFAVIQE
jgi:hypothetical protein